MHHPHGMSTYARLPLHVCEGGLFAAWPGLSRVVGVAGPSLTTILRYTGGIWPYIRPYSSRGNTNEEQSTYLYMSLHQGTHVHVLHVSI